MHLAQKIKRSLFTCSLFFSFFAGWLLPHLPAKVKFKSIKVPEIFRRAVSAPNVGYNIDFVTQHFRFGAGVENYAHKGGAIWSRGAGCGRLHKIGFRFSVRFSSFLAASLMGK